MRLLTCLLMVFLSFFSLPAQAENGGYFDVDYPFAELNHIEVHVRFAPELTNQELYAPLIHDFPMQVITKLNAKKFNATISQVAISAAPALSTQDSKAQATLDVQIHRLETVTAIAPGYTDWRPQVFYLPIHDKSGDIIDYEPYLQYLPYTVPPHRTLQHIIGVTYTLIDAVSEKEISRYSCLRVGAGSPSVLARKTAGAYASWLAKIRSRSLRQ